MIVCLLATDSSQYPGPCDPFIPPDFDKIFPEPADPLLEELKLQHNTIKGIKKAIDAQNVLLKSVVEILKEILKKLCKLTDEPENEPEDEVPPPPPPYPTPVY